MFDDARRDTADNRPICDRSGDDGPRSDDGISSDVVEDDSRTANPRALADVDRTVLPLLVADRNIRACDPVRLATARDVHARRQEHVASDVNPPEMAARTDIRVFADFRLGLGKDRAELDGRGHVAAPQRVNQERAPKVLSNQSGNESEQLRRAFKGPVFAENF